MAIALRAYIDIVWIPDGAGPAVLGVGSANSPGQGQPPTPMPIGNAQTLRLQDGVQVPGGDQPNAGNFATAFNQLSTDLQAALTASILAQINAWATGGP